MELAQSRALIAIGELASFRKAGERLHLSPPAVFAQIHQLESDLGEKLYQRNGRKLVLTPAGRLLLDYCRRIVTTHDEAVGSIRDLGTAQGGSLYLGCGPHISVAIVPYLFRAYLGEHPHVDIRLVTGNDETLIQDLHTGKVDILLMNLPIDIPELVQEPLWRYELVFVVPPTDPAAGRTSISTAELATRPFILYQRSIVIETAIRQFCSAAGFEPRVVMQNDQADSIKELVKLGMGISLLPLWSVSEDFRQGKLRVLRLAGKQLFSVTGLVYRQAAHVPTALRAFITTAHQWASWLPRPEDVIQFRE